MDRVFHNRSEALYFPADAAVDPAFHIMGQSVLQTDLDSNSEFRKSFGGEMIPFVIICDGEGKVVFKHNGYTEGAEQELIEKVRELIK